MGCLENSEGPITKERQGESVSLQMRLVEKWRSTSHCCRVVLLKICSTCCKTIGIRRKVSHTQKRFTCSVIPCWIEFSISAYTSSMCVPQRLHVSDQFYFSRQISTLFSASYWSSVDFGSTILYTIHYVEIITNFRLEYTLDELKLVTWFLP